MILLAPRGFFVRFELRGISLFVDGSGHDVLDSMECMECVDVFYHAMRDPSEIRG